MRKKILLKGPVLTRSGYGEQTRFALRSLRSRTDLFDVYIQPLQWGNTSWLATTDSERAFIDQTIEKTIGHMQGGGQFDISFGNIATQLVAASDAILSLSRASNSATGNKQMGFFGANAVDRVSVGNISSAAVINPDVPNSATAAELTSTQAAITALENKLDALIDALQLYGLIS